MDHPLLELSASVERSGNLAQVQPSCDHRQSLRASIGGTRQQPPPDAVANALASAGTV